MEPTTQPVEIKTLIIPTPITSTALVICSTCHQPILPTYYFCPNCGAKLNSAPLSTSIATQIGIYLFSLILPSLCFMFISHWPAVKYVKSKDPKAKRIGVVAWTLLLLSTLVTFWFIISWTIQTTQSLSNSISSDLGGLSM